MKHIRLLAALVLLLIAGCGTDQPEPAAQGPATPDGPIAPLAASGIIRSAPTGNSDGSKEMEEAPSPNQPPLEYLSESEFRQLRAQIDTSNANLEATSQLHEKAAVEFTKTYTAGMQVANEWVASWNEHICFLERIAGPSRADDTNTASEFSLSRDASGQYVVIKSGNGPEARIHCYPRTQFTGPNGFLPYADGSTYFFLWDECRQTAMLPFNWVVSAPGSVVSLAGFGWTFKASGDWLKVTEPGVSGTYGSMQLRSASSPCRILGYIGGYTARNDGNPVQYYGPNGYGNPVQAGEYHYKMSNGFARIAIGPPGTVCFFTSLNGDLHGALQSAEVTQVNPGAQHLLLSSTSPGWIDVILRCVVKNQ